MKLLPPLIILSAFLLYCTFNSLVSDDGGTTEITNARVSGVIFKACDSTGRGDTIPVEYAVVTLHSQVYKSRVTVTDAAGLFSFDSVDTGRYWLEGNDSDTIGLVQVIDVEKGDSLIDTTMVLNCMGGIRGIVEVDTNSIDPDSAFKTTTVTIPEIEVRLKVDTLTGVFEHKEIPPFNNYSIIITNDFFPLVCDTMKVAVEEGIITDLIGTNLPPVFTHDASTMRDTAFMNQTYRDTVHAIDPDGDELQFVLVESPCCCMHLNDSIITWNPCNPCCKPGTEEVSVQVQDNKGGYDILDWTINVLNLYLPEKR